MGLLIVLFLAGLATWIATSTIVEAEIFRDVREAVDRLHSNKNNWFTYKLRYLISCHMCAGIWVAAIVALMVPPFVSGGVLGWGITALAIKGIAHFFLVVQKYFEAATEEKKADAEWQMVINNAEVNMQEMRNDHSPVPDNRESGSSATGVGWPN